MDAAQIADLITAGMRGPTGPEDVAFYTGTVVSWDEVSGVNSVLLNNTAIPNMKTVQGGIGIQYQPGDTVMVIRKQSQYFVLGKVTAPGGNNANQIKSAEVVTSQTTTSTTYTDLATPGPSVTVNVGSSGRVLVLFGCGITVADTGAGVNNYVGGSAVFDITGATNLAAAAGVSAQIWSPAGAPTGGAWTSSKPKTLTGLAPGSTTFTMKYRSLLTSPACGFVERNITVIPF